MCDTDIDECTQYHDICQNKGRCTNTAGSYECSCNGAFKGKNCSINIDDCKADNGTSKCLHNGTCIDHVGRFSCKCKDPYMGMFNISFPFLLQCL